MLFSESFAAMVGDMLQAGGSRTLVTLPSYPAPFMLDIAEPWQRHVTFIWN